MRTLGSVVALATLLVAASPVAQGQEAFQAVGTMSQVMVSMVYPGANEILLSVYRGGPTTDAEWAVLQRSAVLLGESGNVLMMRGHAMDQGAWMTQAKGLVDVATAASKAIREKNRTALTAVAEPLNASCTNCHKEYRRNVHPRP